VEIARRLPRLLFGFAPLSPDKFRTGLNGRHFPTQLEAQMRRAPWIAALQNGLSAASHLGYPG
jgi:hypothetical protein